MSVYRRGGIWWYKFRFAGQFIRESTKSSSKTLAKDAERKRRRELEEGYNDLSDRRDERVQTVASLAEAYLSEYKLRNRAVTFAVYALGHVKVHLGRLLQVDVSDATVKSYQSIRLNEAAAPKTINEEVGFLLRLLKERGDDIRIKMRREKTLKLKVPKTNGKAYDVNQQSALLCAAAVGSLPVGAQNRRTAARSPFMRPALALGFNTGMRDAEIRNLTWGQVDVEKKYLIVGKSKTTAGEGRTIPLTAELLAALSEHLAWYSRRFGAPEPGWYVFPGRAGRPAPGKPRPYDPRKPISTLKTSWKNVKKRAGVEGRFHDIRHTLITELAESGAGDQTIMDIAGHVSAQMLGRYSHIRMEAKRRALQTARDKNPAGTAKRAGIE